MDSKYTFYQILYSLAIEPINMPFFSYAIPYQISYNATEIHNSCKIGHLYNIYWQLH